jgi:hypothetical protein
MSNAGLLSDRRPKTEALIAKPEAAEPRKA